LGKKEKPRLINAIDFIAKQDIGRPVDWNKKYTPCNATVHFDSGTKINHHQCCLFEEYHKGLKHFTPTLLLTCGGDRATHDIDGNDITKTWSPFSDEKI
jgi:hypothetical protein